MIRRSISVLLVEDKPDDIRLIQRSLDESPTINADITLVGTLTEALDVLLRQRVDIVLLNLSLSDSSGLGSVRVIVRAASRVPI